MVYELILMLSLVFFFFFFFLNCFLQDAFWALSQLFTDKRHGMHGKSQPKLQGMHGKSCCHFDSTQELPICTLFSSNNCCVGERLVGLD